MKKITTIKQLEKIYAEAGEISKLKEIDYINDHYRLFIEASPFLILATSGDKGIDCSPRGDPAGFVRIVDEKTVLIPDRRGNNRLDSLRNIIGNPRVGLIFLIPNSGETIRLSGRAEILLDKELCASFSMNNKPACSVLSITVDKIYMQCQKALARSKLWDSSTYIDRKKLPTAGEMAQNFAAMHGKSFDGKAYDKDYPARMKKTIY